MMFFLSKQFFYARSLQCGQLISLRLLQSGLNARRQRGHRIGFSAFMETEPPSILRLFPLTRTSATFRRAASMILPKVCRETFIWEAACS
jgi:hypothetical protein